MDFAPFGTDLAEILELGHRVEAKELALLHSTAAHGSTAAQEVTNDSATDDGRDEDEKWECHCRRHERFLDGGPSIRPTGEYRA